MIDWKSSTIGSGLREAASTWGSREALTWKDSRYTYEELYRASCRLASGLNRLGVGQGNHVATLFPIRPEWVVAKYALHILGAVIVPLNINFREKELQYVLEKARVDTLITLDTLPQGNYLDILKAIDPAIAASPKGEVRSQAIPALRRIVCLSPNGSRYPYCHDFDEVAALGSGYDEAGIDRLLEKVKPGDPCNILFTSGSTAFPKGAVHIHTSLLGIGEHLFGRTFNLASSDNLLCYMPFYHIAGCVYHPLGALVRGCSLHLNEFIPDEILPLIERKRICHFGGFEAHFNAVMDHPGRKDYDLSSVRCILLATGPEWYDRCKILFPNVRIIATHYGFTEGTGVSCLPDETDEHLRKHANGRPWPGIEIKVVNPVTGERIPPNQGGELCLRGWSRLREYFDSPEETRKAIDAEGFFHSGDYGWLDEKGYVYYRGRYKMMVKTGGENVSQREVEIFLEGIPGVKSVQVIGVPDAKWGEAVTAVIEPEPGTGLTEEDVKAFCRGKISRYKIPKHVLFVRGADWPLLGAGKVNKIALKEMAVKRLGVE
jgi:fatty-acyl-CoA synthase